MIMSASPVPGVCLVGIGMVEAGRLSCEDNIKWTVEGQNKLMTNMWIEGVGVGVSEWRGCSGWAGVGYQIAYEIQRRRDRSSDMAQV